MSAAVVRGLAPEPSRMPSRTVRPRLRLVGPDERVGWGLTFPALRVSRRGRLVITLAVISVSVALALMLAATVDAADTRIDHASTVSVGQSLSDVAAAQLPSLPIHEAVARIQLVNGLNTDQVHAGQLLLIPVMP